jgi:hypothetical protein
MIGYPNCGLLDAKLRRMHHIIAPIRNANEVAATIIIS